jgi:predicted Ser/Thr protein kinase
MASDLPTLARNRERLLASGRMAAEEVAALLEPDRWPEEDTAARIGRRLAALLFFHAAEAGRLGNLDPNPGIDAAAWILDPARLVADAGTNRRRTEQAAEVMTEAAATCRAAWRRQRSRPVELSELEAGGFVAQALIESLRRAAGAVADLDNRPSDTLEAGEEARLMIELAGEVLSLAGALSLIDADLDDLAACMAAKLCARVPTPLYRGLLPPIAEVLDDVARRALAEVTGLQPVLPEVAIPEAVIDTAHELPVFPGAEYELEPPEPELEPLAAADRTPEPPPGAPPPQPIPYVDEGSPPGEEPAPAAPPPPEPMALPNLGRFHVEEELGRGSMGVVYKALHPSLGIPVAIKVVHEHSGNEAIRMRFQREAAAVAALNHPGIVRVYDFDADRDRLFIVMEYLAGRSLGYWLKEMGRLGTDLAVDLAQQVLSAVGAAHDHGIVHRDLKPENILISSQGKAKILDFGVAKLLDDSPQLTAEGFTVGTPTYMAPEQLRGEVVDARSDIYSIGVLLYQMLDGHPPFQGTVTSVMHAHVFDIAPDSPNIPVPLMAAIRRSLAKSPNERFQTCAEFAAAIRELGRSGALTPRLAGAQPLAMASTIALERKPPVAPAPPPGATPPRLARCLRSDCGAAATWTCEYKDSEGRTCDTAWCGRHVAMVGDDAYCARHAAVVRALIASQGTAWAIKERPPIGDRAMPFAVQLRDAVDADVREIMRRRFERMPSLDVVADQTVRRVGTGPDVQGWECSWAALSERQCLLRVDLEVSAGAEARVSVAVNEEQVLSDVVGWAHRGADDVSLDRLAAGMVAAVQAAAERSTGEPTRIIDVPLPDIDRPLLRELMLRLLHQAGSAGADILADQLALPASLVGAELGQLVEDGLAEWEREGVAVLSKNGRRRAEDSPVGRYRGPMPVSVAEYTEVLNARRPAADAATVRSAAAPWGMEPAVAYGLLGSPGPVLVYGPPGVGKSSLVRALARALPATLVPVAIDAGGLVMRVFDPARHKLAGEQPADRRWRRIEAPLVEFGSELTVDMLESHAGTDGLVAPPQLLAAGGILMVDDLGRQAIAPRQLFDRLAPIAQRGLVTVRAGGDRRVTLPFTGTLVFATSLVPEQILSDFQLRHIPLRLPLSRGD